VDQTLIKVNGHRVYLYRAFDHEGTLLDVRVSEACDLTAARSFFRAARMISKRPPIRVTSARHGSYPGAIRLELGPMWPTGRDSTPITCWNKIIGQSSNAPGPC
jgi:transposase-like protein